MPDPHFALVPVPLQGWADFSLEASIEALQREILALEDCEERAMQRYSLALSAVEDERLPPHTRMAAQAEARQALEQAEAVQLRLPLRRRLLREWQQQARSQAQNG
jgi:hypothetical protein